jgi:hypothetical protein
MTRGPQVTRGPRTADIDRRRQLAYRALPPDLAIHFTVGEAAALRIVADECRDKGHCALVIDKIAARSRTNRTTIRRALREAERLGLLLVTQRPGATGPDGANHIRILSSEWREWHAEESQNDSGITT